MYDKFNFIEQFKELVIDASRGDPLLVALLMSMFAALMTAIGSLPIFLVERGRDGGDGIIEDLIDVGLGFGSGVMIVASFTSLLLPSIAGAGIWLTLAGFIMGAAVIALANEIIPHEHLFKKFEGWSRAMRKIKAAWLVSLAILIHNFPEGYSIGVASAYNITDGVRVGLAIGFQDIPEGLAVALPILAITGSRLIALSIAVLSGLSEVIAALIAALLFSTPHILYLGLSSAAGAMIYVVSHEAIPESHRIGSEKKATVGFFLGFIVMLFLDTVLR